MRKLLILLFFPFLLPGCSVTPQSQKFQGAKGNPSLKEVTGYKVFDQFDENFPKDKEIYKYNLNGETISLDVYRKEELVHQTVYEYNKNGVCTKETYTSVHGLKMTDTLVEKKKFREIRYEEHPTGEIYTTIIVTVAKHSQKVVANSEGVIYNHETRDYDENGNIIEYKVYIDQDIYHWEEMEYDEDNKIMKQIIHKSFVDPYSITYTYQYTQFDEKGNWTEQLKYENETLREVTTRRFEYFN